MAQVTIDNAAKSTSGLKVNASTGDAIVQLYEGGSSNGNVYINTSDGERKILLGSAVDSYINNGKNLGINTSSPDATLDVNGSLQAQTVTFTKLPDASTAPSGADLEAVVVDTSTGILYQQ